jgi:hypothetical protein
MATLSLQSVKRSEVTRMLFIPETTAHGEECGQVCHKISQLGRAKE